MFGDTIIKTMHKIVVTVMLNYNVNKLLAELICTDFANVFVLYLAINKITFLANHKMQGRLFRSTLVY